MIRYEVEGDKNMPYNLSKIMIVSTADRTIIDIDNTIKRTYSYGSF